MKTFAFWLPTGIEPALSDLNSEVMPFHYGCSVKSVTDDVLHHEGPKTFGLQNASHRLRFRLPPTSRSTLALLRAVARLDRFRGTRLRLPPLTDVPSAPRRVRGHHAAAPVRYGLPELRGFTPVVLHTRLSSASSPCGLAKVWIAWVTVAGDGWSPRLSLSRDSLLAMPKVLVTV